MPERVSPEALIGSLGLAGLIIGLGQLLASEEKLTPRLVLGRAITSAGIGASAASFLTLYPDLPLTAMFGIACLLASLGTSVLERIFQKLLGIK